MQNTEPKALPIRDPMVHDLHIRVSRIEQNAQSTHTEMAVMKNDMSYIKEELGGITKGVNRILWAIGMSFLAAGITFVLSGDLAIIQ